MCQRWKEERDYSNYVSTLLRPSDLTFLNKPHPDHLHPSRHPFRTQHHDNPLWVFWTLRVHPSTLLYGACSDPWLCILHTFSLSRLWQLQQLRCTQPALSLWHAKGTPNRDRRHIMWPCHLERNLTHVGTTNNVFLNVHSNYYLRVITDFLEAFFALSCRRTHQVIRNCAIIGCAMCDLTWS